MTRSRILLSSFLVLFINLFSNAQCSMCKAVAESNMKGGGSMAEGLNSGILYLMAFPYILIGVVAFMWYRHSKSHSVQ